MIDFIDNIKEVVTLLCGGATVGGGIAALIMLPQRKRKESLTNQRAEIDNEGAAIAIWKDSSSSLHSELKEMKAEWKAEKAEWKEEREELKQRLRVKSDKLDQQTQAHIKLLREHSDATTELQYYKDGFCKKDQCRRRDPPKIVILKANDKPNNKPMKKINE